MHIEIDQSQRIEEARDTILAFSDREKYAIRVPALVKAAARQLLRAKRKDKGVILEAWIPEFDVASAYEREPGPYEMFCNAKPKGSDVALDWLLIDSFSHA